MYLKYTRYICQRAELSIQQADFAYSCVLLLLRDVAVHAEMLHIYIRHSRLRCISLWLELYTTKSAQTKNQLTVLLPHSDHKQAY